MEAEEPIVISSGTGSDSNSSAEEEALSSPVVFTPTKRPPSPDSDSDVFSVDSVPSCKKRIKFEDDSPPGSPSGKEFEDDSPPGSPSGKEFEDDSPPGSPSGKEYYCGDPQLPVYSRVTSGYAIGPLIKVLMTGSVDLSEVCTVRPQGVSENATFVIDLDEVGFSDIKSDDMGSWKTTGTKSTWFRLTADGPRIAEKKPQVSELCSYLVLTRRYYVHSTYHLYHRIIVDIQDASGARNNRALVQYMFDGPEVQVKVKPHGNSKQATPYFRTSETARDAIKKVATSHTPKLAVDCMTKDLGGEMNANPSSLPRNRQQISNIRRMKGTKDKNVLYSVMVECKLAQGSDAFVRDVKAAPSPQSVMFFDWQLSDMVRFLTNNRAFGILTADTTFNLGDFYVTPTTYRHLMLEDVKSGKHPCVLGPVLVHQQVDFASFNYFASTLISHDRRLRNILSFGTDGDKAIIEAFSHNFPCALQLRCFVHFKKNVQEKLRSLGIPSSVAELFLTDIFGQCRGSAYQEGLVDCSSEREFDEKLQRLEETWNARERPHAPESGCRFYDHFCYYQADVVKYNMRRDLRESVGLGCPPSIFTTNSSESINAAIKRKVDYKEHQWPEFNEHLKQQAKSQREEIFRCLSARGQYRLLPEFRHLATTVQEWSKMRPEQRVKMVADFDAASLSKSSAKQGGSSGGVTESTGTLPSQTASAGVKVGLSIDADDCGIHAIPIVTLQAMWSKANRLLSMENGLTSAPGSDKKARMVLSLGSETPHFVRSRANHLYVCDANCPQWSSAKICSHTLAVAETNGELSGFLQWYVRSGTEPNITTLAMKGLPGGRGRKGGKPKRKRTRTSTPQPVTTINQSYHSSSFTGCVTGSGSLTPSSSGDTQHFVPPTSEPFRQPQVQHSAVGPPPLIPMTTVNVNPFYVKFIAGNIRVCQGCRGSLRMLDGSVPAAPFNLTIARAERRSFRNSIGNLVTPARETVCHYHCKPECVLAVEPHLVCSSLRVPADVLGDLSPVHIQHLQSSFDVLRR